MNRYQVDQQIPVIARNKAHIIFLLIVKHLIPTFVAVFVFGVILNSVINFSYQPSQLKITEYNLIIFLNNAGVDELNPAIVSTSLPASYVDVVQSQPNRLQLNIPTAFTPQFPLVSFGQPSYIKLFVYFRGLFGVFVSDILEFDIDVTAANSLISQNCSLSGSGTIQSLIAPTFTNIDPSVYNQTTRFLPQKTSFIENCIINVSPAPVGITIDVNLDFMAGKFIPSNLLMVFTVFSILLISAIGYFGTYLILDQIYTSLFIFGREM